MQASQAVILSLLYSYDNSSKRWGAAAWRLLQVGNTFLGHGGEDSVAAEDRYIEEGWNHNNRVILIIRRKHK